MACNIKRGAQAHRHKRASALGIYTDLQYGLIHGAQAHAFTSAQAHWGVLVCDIKRPWRASAPYHKRTSALGIYTGSQYGSNSCAQANAFTSTQAHWCVMVCDIKRPGYRARKRDLSQARKRVGNIYWFTIWIRKRTLSQTCARELGAYCNTLDGGRDNGAQRQGTSS
jgi:hypothetical protein